MRRIALALLAMLCLTGCGDQKLLEKLGYILAISFDTAKTDKGESTLRIGYAIPKSGQDKQIFISTVAQTKKQATMALSRENDFELVSGQTRMVLFSKEFARSGINKQLDTFTRDPSIRGKVKLLIVDGDAGELLSKEMPQYTPTSLFLNNLLATSSKLHIVPVADLFTFGRDLLDDGIDPVVPVLKSEADTVKITGIGLFKDTRYVDSLEAPHLALFALLQGRIKGTNIGMEAQENKEKSVLIGLDHLSGSRKIKVSVHHPIRSGEDVRITIELRLRGAVTEYTGDLNLQQARNQLKLEALMNRSLEAEAKKIMAQLKQHKVDPLGMGQYVRQQTPYAEWNALEWHDIVAAADIDVKAVVKIKNYGKIER